MHDMHHSQDGMATIIFCDSLSCIAIGKNHVFHARMKHIKNHYYYIQYYIANDFIELIYCPHEDTMVDIFTKFPKSSQHKFLYIIKQAWE